MTQQTEEQDHLGVQEFNMITVEEKQALETKINDLKTEIRVLEEELLVNERVLWWSKRPHIESFTNDYEMESDDEGGGYAVWQPYSVQLNKKWLAQEGNQQLVDKQLAFLEDYSDDYLICGLEDETEPYFGEDPYPGFHDWSLNTVRNPNYV